MSAVIEHTQTTVPQAQSRGSILAKFASKYEVQPARMLTTLKATAFRQGRDAPEVSDEQMIALLIVADQYGLNPFTKEIYAFPDKHKGIVPVVGVDGWSRIMNENPQFDGVEFEFGPPVEKTGGVEWVECSIYRKDRNRPTVVREFLRECKRSTDPWSSHPTRMLRHKALIQCARVAFGFAGIYDQDEAEQIIEGGVRVVRPADDPFAAVNQRIEQRPAAQALPQGGEQGHDAGGEQSDAAPEPKPESKPADSDAPSVTYAQLEQQMRRAKTVEALDDAALLIQALPADQQPDAAAEHGRLRAKLTKE